MSSAKTPFLSFLTPVFSGYKMRSEWCSVRHKLMWLFQSCTETPQSTALTTLWDLKPGHIWSSEILSRSQTSLSRILNPSSSGVLEGAIKFLKEPGYSTKSSHWHSIASFQTTELSATIIFYDLS